MEPRKIKTIIFDNEKVLVGQDWNRVAKIASERLPIPCVNGNLFLEKLQANSSPIEDEENLLQTYSKGLIPRKDYWSQILTDQFHLPATDDAINHLSSSLEYLTTTVNCPLIDKIKQLKKNNYGLILVSNCTAEINAGNRGRNNYFDLFDKTYFSFQHGLRKPELPYYEKVLRENSLNAEECLFIDDKFSNLKAASALGMQTIKYDITESIEFLVDQLKKKGVII